ncbi:MAG: putative Fe-S cluster assembly protein SufT [Mariprofundales bacterium]|nr:putative Fe-S cluster assembly protein SufT [Mariprofundales bacterium]
MPSRNWTVTTDNIDAIMIPLGTPVVIPKGAKIAITQQLGGSYTVEVGGNLARVDGKDAAALGVSDNTAEEPLTQPIDDTPGIIEEDRVREELKTCYDPEIPVNIVDLGLVYDIHIVDDDDGNSIVEIIMTLTAPGCGMGPFIIEDVRSKVLALRHVHDVHVELVFDPPWDRAMMSDTAKLQLGMF